MLVLAVAGGLFTAWIVANCAPCRDRSRAHRRQLDAGERVPRPARSAGATAEPTEAPRRTPTALPTVEVTPAAVHLRRSAGRSLINIADLYQVAVQDIIDLNDIKNPNRIFVGQELLIPGYGVTHAKPTKPPK